MKKLVLIAGMVIALMGITACESDVDVESLVGEWGVLEYTYNTSIKSDPSKMGLSSMGNFEDQTARSFSFIFNEDGSGANVRYGYYIDDEDEKSRFVDDYYSYPFEWSLNGDKLTLNYPGENPVDLNEQAGPADSPESFLKRSFPIGTEFDTKFAGNKLVLECHQTSDLIYIDSAIRFERK